MNDSILPPLPNPIREDFHDETTHEWWDFFAAKQMHDYALSAIAHQQERIKELQAQLPEQMQDCTIQFKECIKGHGWLTATNWVQHGCPTCRIHELETEVSRIENEHRRIYSMEAEQIERPMRLRAERAEAELSALKAQQKAIDLAIQKD